MNNSYPSKRYLNYLDFTIYIHQRYFERNIHIDEMCPDCSEQMELKIIDNENTFSWLCNKCNLNTEFKLNISKIEQSHRRNDGAYYGFCSCNYDVGGTGILYKTPPELLKIFISIFFWLVNIDENLHSESLNMATMNIYGGVYETFKFPKLYAHGAWGKHHMDPIFLFNSIGNIEYDNIKKIIPSVNEIKKIKYELWGEVNNFIINSYEHQGYMVNPLIARMNECLRGDTLEVINRINTIYGL